MAYQHRYYRLCYPFERIKFGILLVATIAENLKVNFYSVPDFSDVFFESENVFLNCSISGSTHPPRISIYHNDDPIYVNGSSVDTGNHNRFQFSSSNFSVKLIILNVSMAFAGQYKCQVWRNQSTTATDTFDLNVAPSWPQCIVKCEEENVKYLCYTKLADDPHFMSWENSTDGGIFEIYTHFTTMQTEFKVIGVSNVNIAKEHGGTYKCFYKSNDNPQINTFCIFSTLTTNSEASNGILLTTTPEQHQNGLTNTQDGILYVTTERLEEDSAGSQSSTFSTGATVSTGVAVISIACLVVTAVVFVVNSQISKGKREDDDHVRSVTNGNNTGTTISSTSFVNVSLDRYEQRDTLNGGDANDNDACERLKLDTPIIDGSYADLRVGDPQYHVTVPPEQGKQDMVNPNASYADSRRDHASYDEVPGCQDKDRRDLVNPGASYTDIRQDKAPNNVPRLRQDQDERDMVNPDSSTSSAYSRRVDIRYDVPGRQGHDRRDMVSLGAIYPGSRRRDASYDGQEEQDKRDVVNSDASSASSRRGDAPYDIPGEQGQGKAAEFGPYKVVSIDDIHRATSGRDFSEPPGYDTVDPGTNKGKSGTVHYEVLDSTKEEGHY